MSSIIFDYSSKKSGWSFDEDFWQLQIPSISLDNNSSEVFEFSENFEIKSRNAWSYIISESHIIGYYEKKVNSSHIRFETNNAYNDLFKIIGDKKLYRIWNYIPEINTCTNNLEHYRSFSIGRSDSFTDNFKKDSLVDNICSASAVGSIDDTLIFYFIAGSIPPKHFENTDQVPAYNYPDTYGPKPPLFARATKVLNKNNISNVYISGTSAVIGHESHGEGDLLSQIQITLKNLEKISSIIGTAKDNAISARTYIRNSEDFPVIKELVNQSFLKSSHNIYVQADICRKELLLETELNYFIG